LSAEKITRRSDVSDEREEFVWVASFTGEFDFTDELDTDTLVIDTFAWGRVDFDFACDSVFICEARDGLLLAFFVGDGDCFLSRRGSGGGSRGRGRRFWWFEVELDGA
jgi:hypothetical protein